MSGLTYKTLLDMIDALTPLCYYAEADAVPAGTVLEMRETDYTHRAWLFHTGEFAAFCVQVPGVRWRHLRDAPIKLPSSEALQ